MKLLLRALVIFVAVAHIVITLCGKATAQLCFPDGDDCFSGGTDPALVTYEACCRPLLDDNTVRRSFMSNGHCFECIEIGLDQPMYTLNESNTVYTRRLRLLAPTGYTGFARPRLRLNGIPGTAGVNDFSLVTSDILLTNPVAGIDIAITISVDGIAGEPPEVFTISFQPPGVSDNADPMFLFRNTTVTIIDTDKPTYQFDQGDNVESEGSGSVIVVNVQQIVSSIQDVHLLLVPLTYVQYIARAATDPTLAAIDVYHGSRPDPAEYNDFDMTVHRVLFPANSGNMASQRVSFPILDDAINEEHEGFIIVLYRDTNLTSIEVAFTPNLRTTIGRINDDDPFYFGFDRNEISYNEARDAGQQKIKYSPAPGNKTEKSFMFLLFIYVCMGNIEMGDNGDFRYDGSPFLTFVPNAAPENRTVTFSLNHDMVVEGQEIVNLQIERTTSISGFEPRFQNVRIIINDSDIAVFNLSTPLVVYEQKGSTFNATIALVSPSGGSTIPFRIDIMETEITATHADFQRRAPFSFIFHGTNRSICCEELVPYAVTDDNIAEPNETVTISITSNSSISVDFVVQQINVTIVDNDVARIGFVQCPGVVNSVEEVKEFTEIPVAVLDSNIILDREVIVRFSTVNNSAKAGSDYTSTVKNLTFSNNVRRIVVRVPILQDAFLEGTEQFRVSLSLVQSNGINVAVSPDQDTVNIIDDDVTVIGFTQKSVTVNEDDMSATLTVRIISGPLATGDWAELEFITSDMPSSNTSAVSPDDYTNVTRLLNFTSSTTEFAITVPIVNDKLIELTESFLTNLSIVSKLGVEIILQPEQAVVSIRSEDATDQCFTSSVDCLGATDLVQNTTFETCCQAVLDNNTIERSFKSNGRCFGCIVIGLDQPMYLLNERNEVHKLKLKLLSSTRSHGFDRPRLRLMSIPGTATMNDYFLLMTLGDLLLRNPAAGIDINIIITDDGIAGEPPESFTITYQQPTISSNADPLFLFRNTTVTIMDTNKPTYQFDQGDYVESEGSGNAIVVNVLQMVPSVQDIHLLLVPLTYKQYIARAATDPTLAAIDVYHGSRPDPAEHDIRQDFNMTVRRVCFPATNDKFNRESRRLSFPIMDDTINEEPEGFIIVMYRDDNLTSIEVAFTRHLRTTLGRINDDDPFFFGFVHNEITYDEARDEGQHELMYRPALGNKTEKSFMFSLNLNALVGGFEFGDNGDITFGTGVIRPTFTFNPNDAPENCLVNFSVVLDKVVEGKEIGQLQIARSNSFDGFEPQFQNVRIIINDSNIAEFNLSAPPVVYEQNFSAMISLIEPSGGTTLQIEIDIMELGITADVSRSNAPPFIFQGTDRPGCCKQSVQYQVNDDNVAEPDEILTISIARSITSASIPVKFIVQRVNVTIMDNDVARIGFENIIFSVEEGSGSGAGFAEIPVAVLGTITLGGEVTVRFSTSDLSAIAGSDYNSTVMDLMFSAAVRRHVVRVPITQDSFYECNELFTGSLSLVQCNGINVDVSPNQTTVKITGDEVVAVIGFVKKTVIVNETDMSAILNVSILNGTLPPGVWVEVEFTTSDMPSSNTSAMSSVDYMSENKPINFTNSTTEFIINVTIFNDQVAELTESFLTNLRLISSVSAHVIIDPGNARAVVEIHSEDVARIGIENITLSVHEGAEFANLTVAVLDTTVLGEDVTVRFSTTDLSATAGSDYNSTETELTFNSSVQCMVVMVPILQDALFEGNEQFHGSLSLVQSNGINVAVSPNQTIVNIIDDDEVVIGFVQNMVVVNETDMSVTLTVSILNGTLAPGAWVEVEFTTSDMPSYNTSAAMSSVDFINGTRLLNFTSSTTVFICNLKIIYYQVSELPESFLFTLSLISSVSAHVIIDPGNASAVFGIHSETVIITGMSMLRTPLANSVIATFLGTSLTNSVIATSPGTSLTNSVTSPTTPQETRTETIISAVATSLTNSVTSPTTPQETRTETIISAVIAAVFAVVLITIIICIIIVYYCKRYYVMKTITFNSTDNSFELKAMHTSPPINVAPEILSLVSNVLILKWQVRLLDILGQGEFGVVYKAHLLQSKNGNDYIIVAVKTLKGCFDDDDVEQLVKESLQMKNFQHRNVIGMLGVCLDAGPAPYLVLPYMKNGDLLSYLKSNREELVLSQDEPEENKAKVQTKLLLMCLQIANGMQYLADNDIVHRDLAARNCMIDENWIIKVADFGLTRSVYEKRYFRQEKDESVKLPIKWMAIESIDDAVFTEKTDVWSFGVTCWEIFNGGRVPYGGLHPLSIVRMLRCGERMDPPESSACSSEVFATIMLQCWEGDPDGRPTFSQLKVTIDEMVTSMTDYMELSVF